jgi:hypothetical protein
MRLLQHERPVDRFAVLGDRIPQLLVDLLDRLGNNGLHVGRHF